VHQTQFSGISNGISSGLMGGSCFSFLSFFSAINFYLSAFIFLINSLSG
jgi:hypothetical protein